MDEVLKIIDLHIDFRTRAGIVHAVRGVDLTLHKGEILGVVGESGSGKSVTAMSVLRLLAPNAVVGSGQIIYCGADLLAASEKELRKIRGGRISMIFQDSTSSLNPLIPVGKQVEEIIREHEPDVSASAAKKRALDLFSRVQISNAEDRYRDFPHQFSGGMRQRVMIAIALACGPDIIIADEPTTSLDVTIQDQILNLLLNLHKEMQTSVIFITHDFGIVRGFCTRVAVMYGGMIMEEAATGELFESPTHPYTRGLLDSIPRAGGPRNVRFTQIPGAPPNMLKPPPGCPFAPRCGLVDETCEAGAPTRAMITETHSSICIRGKI